MMRRQDAVGTEEALPVEAFDQNRAGLTLWRDIHVDEAISAGMLYRIGGDHGRFWIGSFVVQNREQLIVFQSFQAGDRFHNATAGAEVAHVTFQRYYGNGQIAEHSLDGGRFSAIAIFGSQSVSVNVTHIAG